MTIICRITIHEKHVGFTESIGVGPVPGVKFEIADEADYFLLFGMYAPEANRTRHVSKYWYKDCTLLFTAKEMKTLLASCKTVGGEPDKMFGFGFNTPKQIFQTRGDQHRKYKDYSNYLLEKRLSEIKEHLSRGR